MVLVDIFVPSVDKTYDFQLNENIPIKLLIEEMAEMIGQKEHSEMIGNIEELQLCSRMEKRVLDGNASLAMSNVKTGDSLILV